MMFFEKERKKQSIYRKADLSYYFVQMLYYLLQIILVKVAKRN